MKYKPGDEVLIKGEITDVHEGTDNPYFVAHKHGYINWVSEDKIIPADKTYADGLNDAWELAKKIRVQPSNGGIPISELEEIFGTTFIDTIFKNNTYEEALAKIEAYEKGKEIKVGDEVKNITTGNTFWVIAISKENIHGYSSSAEFHDFPLQRFPKNFDVLVKTGRTTDAIELLKQIGE